MEKKGSKRVIVIREGTVMTTADWSDIGPQAKEHR
jgi:hypothetical protein